MKKEEKISIVGVSFLTLGLVAGWLGRQYLVEESPMNSETVLKNVREQFLKEGPIEGSWIELDTFHYKKFALETDVYRGGISRIEDGQLAQYEFIADAYTGSPIDIKRL